MYVHALATDYDETIADEGVVLEATQAALAQLKETGRKLILVTGRELADLKLVFPDSKSSTRSWPRTALFSTRPLRRKSRTWHRLPRPSSSSGCRHGASARFRSEGR